MRLQFIYHGKDKNIHPFDVKSNWEPPVQQSVTLESYLYKKLKYILRTHQ